MKLADFGLAIEVQGDQQAWFGKHLLTVLNNNSKNNTATTSLILARSSAIAKRPARPWLKNYKK